MSLLDPISQDPTTKWDAKSARHLLNRAGFGVPPKAVERLAAMSPEAAVAAFVDFENQPDMNDAPPELPERYDYKQYKQMREKYTEQELRQLRNEHRRKEKQAMVELQMWWLNRMCNGQRPLQEKVALFWHGHFATSAEKVQDPTQNLELNEIFRNMGTGNFRELVRAVGKSGAMMRYLDQQQSNKEKPNENWARELMELFTLGIGHYTEKDIKEAARAFTGWSVRDGEFYYALRRHDFGLKTILGQTASFDGDAVVNHVVAQPACSEFICRKLWKYFAYDNPEPEVVTGLAETLRKHDYNLKPVLRQMFLSRAFYQDKAYFSQIKSPAQLVAQLLVQLDAEDREEAAMIGVYAMRAMGQSLFYPPNVKGWDGGRAWINTNTLLVRYNFSNFLVSGIVPDLKGQQGGNQLRRQFLLAALGKKDDTDDESMAGGNSMMANGMMAPEDDDTPDTPAGQDAMPKDIPAKTFYNKLRERRDKKRKMAGMTKEERREQAMLDEAMEIAPFKAREFFSKYSGKSSDEIVEGLSKYFIGFSLDDQQRARLKNIIGQSVADGQAVPVNKMAEEDLRATVQLMLSTVEYQVC